MKAIFIILDGLGDRPSPELGGKTPLQYALTPNMDKLAELSITGQQDPISPGIVPGSDTAHLALFGADPFEVYTGRGPFEAAGIGMTVRPGDVAFRANFATIDENGIVIDRRAGRIRGKTEELIALLNGEKIEDVEIILGKGVEHRAALILRGPGLSDKVSGNDPKKAGLPLKEFKPLDDSEEARKTARVLNKLVQLARERFPKAELNQQRIAEGKPPATGLLIRGAGKTPHVPSFPDHYHLSAACIAGGGLYKGVARLLNMDIIDVEGATASTDTNLDGKVAATLNALETYDFVFLHIKATDNLGHDGNPKGKAEFIEKIDRSFAPFLDLSEDVVLVLTGDHSTPCDFKDHSADPVPILLKGKYQRVDEVTRFDEYSVVHGGLGRIRGKDIMPLIINEMRLAKKFGA